MDFLKGMVSMVGAIPVGVIGMFAPGILKKLGLETAADWQKAGFEEWEALGDELMKLQAEARMVSVEKQLDLLQQAGEQAKLTLEEMSATLGDMGVKGKKAKGRVTEAAERGLKAMMAAEDPEKAAEVLKTAMAMGKTPAEQQAIGSMLAAAGASAFQYGGFAAMEDPTQATEKMMGEMRKEGLGYLEAVTAAQLEGLSEAEKQAGKKGKKNIQKQRAATEKALETISGAMTAPEAPTAPAAVDIGGGIQMLPPPPPAAAGMTGPGGSWVQAQAPGAGGGAQNVTIVAQNVSMKGQVTGPLHSQYTGENQVVSMGIG